MRRCITAAAVVFGCVAFSAPARSSPWSSQLEAARATHTASVPSQRVNWFAFSPEDQGMDLVMYGIYSAKRSIHVLSYVMTYRPLLQALADKARSGVQVAVVVDYGESVANDRTGYIRQGLGYLEKAGVRVCAIDAYRISHDKAMVLDGRSVQTGSINYTAAGARENSENAVIEWNDVDSAAGFERHFQTRLEQCHPF